MAHLIELINSHNHKIMVVNLDNVIDIYQYDSSLNSKCKLTLGVRDPDGEPQVIDCIESVEQIICIAEATQPLNETTLLLHNLIIEQRKYNELIQLTQLTSIPATKPIK